MRALFGFGIVLLLVGLFILARPMISYTDREKAVDLGPIEVTTETRKTVPMPQLLGVVTAAAGVALIVAGRRRSVA